MPGVKYTHIIINAAQVKNCTTARRRMVEGMVIKACHISVKVFLRLKVWDCNFLNASISCGGYSGVVLMVIKMAASSTTAPA